MVLQSLKNSRLSAVDNCVEKLLSHGSSISSCRLSPGLFWRRVPAPLTFDCIRPNNCHHVLELAQCTGLRVLVDTESHDQLLPVIMLLDCSRCDSSRRLFPRKQKCNIIGQLQLFFRSQSILVGSRQVWALMSIAQTVTIRSLVLSSLVKLCYGAMKVLLRFESPEIPANNLLRRTWSFPLFLRHYDSGPDANPSL